MVQQQKFAIDGDWDGTYSYGGYNIGSLKLGSGMPSTPFWVRFQTTGLGTVAGSVFDLVPQQREAMLNGTYDGQVVRFVKQYAILWAEPIQYEGTMSPDGWAIAGTWIIQGRLFGVIPTQAWGTWEARRRPPVSVQ
ncbi:MAG: hypothetical protein ACLQVD_21640 [Capsulimonadaceae bacterium]